MGRLANQHSWHCVFIKCHLKLRPKKLSMKVQFLGRGKRAEPTWNCCFSFFFFSFCLLFKSRHLVLSKYTHRKSCRSLISWSIPLCHQAISSPFPGFFSPLFLSFWYPCSTPQCSAGIVLLLQYLLRPLRRLCYSPPSNWLSFQTCPVWSVLNWGQAREISLWFVSNWTQWFSFRYPKVTQHSITLLHSSESLLMKHFLLLCLFFLLGCLCVSKALTWGGLFEVTVMRYSAVLLLFFSLVLLSHTCQISLLLCHNEFFSTLLHLWLPEMKRGFVKTVEGIKKCSLLLFLLQCRL